MKKTILTLTFITSLSAFSKTPLERAAAWGNLDKVKTLLSQGVDVNAVDEDSTWEKTALFAASEAGHFEVVEFLISQGADSSITSAAGATPLRAAAYKGHAEVVTVILKNGADPEHDTDFYQRSPLVWAILGAKRGTTTDYVNVLEAFAKYGAKCPMTFTHPVNNSVVKVAESAKQAGDEIANAFSKICKGD